MAPKPPKPTAFNPKPASKPIVMSAADSAPPAPPAPPARVASGQSTSAYDSQYNSATTDAQKQAIVAARDETNAGIAAANDAWHKARGTGPYAGMGGTTQTTAAVAPVVDSTQMNNDIAAAQQFFQSNGMSALWEGAKALLVKGYRDPATISNILSNDSTYQAAYFSRCPAAKAIRDANAALAAAGKPPRPELSPAAYVAVEAAYRQALAGLPAGMFGTTEDVTSWIVGDVSAVELGSRVTRAKNYIYYDANSSIKRELRSIYGMTDSEMVAYTLDAKRSLGAIEAESEKRMRQATVGAAAVDSGLAISNDLRDQLSGNEAYSNSYANSSAGFNKVAKEVGSWVNLAKLSGDSLTADDLVSEQFGMKGAAGISNRKDVLASQERGRFSGGYGVDSKSFKRNRAGTF